jgi:hypothetical protein
MGAFRRVPQQHLLEHLGHQKISTAQYSRHDQAALEAKALHQHEQQLHGDARAPQARTPPLPAIFKIVRTSSTLNFHRSSVAFTD